MLFRQPECFFQRLKNLFRCLLLSFRQQKRVCAPPLLPDDASSPGADAAPAAAVPASGTGRTPRRFRRRSPPRAGGSIPIRPKRAYSTVPPRFLPACRTRKRRMHSAERTLPRTISFFPIRSTQPIPPVSLILSESAHGTIFPRASDALSEVWAKNVCLCTAPPDSRKFPQFAGKTNHPNVKYCVTKFLLNKA